MKAAQRNPRLISKLPVMARIRHDINFIKIDINGAKIKIKKRNRARVKSDTHKST